MSGHPVRIISPDQLKGAGEVGPFPIEQFERRCLAQGDSWFSIGAVPPFLTTNVLLELDELERGTCIVNCAAPGATLKRMVDTLRSKVFRRLLVTEKWDAILLSGSGNDLIAALGADDPDPARRLLARQEEWGDASTGGGRYLSAAGWLTFTDHIRAMFEELVAIRATGPSAQCAIVLHTYDVPTPRDAPAGPGFGPWFSKALQHFQVPVADWESVAEVLFGRLHVLLQGISDSDPSLLLVDTMGVLQKAFANDRGGSGDWQNEIHPTRAGYNKLAQRWEGVLNGALQ